MKQFLARVLGKRSPGNKTGASKPPAPVSIGGAEVQAIEFLGVSRLGNLSWKGWMNGQPVKIFEAFHAEHARTAAEIMCSPELQNIFPQVYLRKEQYLVVEWVEGTLLDAVILNNSRRYIEGMYALQRQMHASTAKLSQPFFYDYFDYLVQRYRRFAGPFDQDNTRFLEAIDLPDPGCAGCEKRIFHLDLTPKNIILHKDGMKIIDNELLGYGIFYPFDFFNTYHSIRNYPGAEDYLQLVKQNEAGSLRYMLEHKELFLNMWNLRMVGNAIQSNKPFSKMLRRGDAPLSHPIFEMFEQG